MLGRWSFLAVWLLTGVAVAAPTRGKVPAAATTCNEPSECELYAADCCGDCGTVTAENVVAYNADWISEHAQPGCVGIGCPKCTEADNDQTRHQLVAACEHRKCVVKKLDQLSITQCRADKECLVVTPGCCACNWRNSVAVRADKKDALYRMTCTTSNMGVGCPQCAQVGPKPHVVCKQGRCALKIVKADAAGPGPGGP